MELRTDLNTNRDAHITQFLRFLLEPLPVLSIYFSTLVSPSTGWNSSISTHLRGYPIRMLAAWCSCARGLFRWRGAAGICDSRGGTYRLRGGGGSIENKR